MAFMTTRHYEDRLNGRPVDRALFPSHPNHDQFHVVIVGTATEIVARSVIRFINRPPPSLESLPVISMRNAANIHLCLSIAPLTRRHDRGSNRAF